MHRLVLALACSALALIQSSPLPAQAVDSSTMYLRGLLKGLAPSTRVQLHSSGQRWKGRVAARQPDSLTIAGWTGTRSLALDAIDTLWLRRESHEGLSAGAGFGALMFFVLQLGNGGDPVSATRLGGILFLGAAGGGMLIDAASERWVRRYPE
jgi:hypothetical protein